MGKKSKSSSSSQTYTPSAEEKALQQQALEYSKYVMPNAKKLNDTAANLLYGSLGNTQVDYNDLMNNALDQIKWGQQGLRGLAQGQIPTAYQDAMEASIQKGVQGSMGNLLQDMGARGVVNSSVMDTGLRGISDSASDAMAQNWQNTVSQLANIYGQNIDAAGGGRAGRRTATGHQSLERLFGPQRLDNWGIGRTGRQRHDDHDAEDQRWRPVRGYPHRPCQ